MKSIRLLALLLLLAATHVFSPGEGTFTSASVGLISSFFDTVAVDKILKRVYKRSFESRTLFTLIPLVLCEEISLGKNVSFSHSKVYILGDSRNGK